MKTRIQAEGETSSDERDGASASARGRFRVPRWARALRDLMRSEGVDGVYRGAMGKTVHSIASSFLYFYAFSGMRREYEARTGRKIGTGATLLSAALAGCVNVLVTEPLDTYVTRKQLKTKNSTKMTDAKEGKVSESDEGLKETLKALRGASDSETAEARGLYSGLAASLALTINPAIQYTAFEQLRQRLMMMLNVRAQRHGILKPVVELSTFDAFILGAVSKAAATVLTYPLVRAKVLQKAGTREEDTKSLIGTLQRVHREEGVSGLYKGLDAQLVKTVLAGAALMTVKEKTFSSALWMMIVFRGLDKKTS